MDDEINGNGDLTNPVALATMDEIMMTHMASEDGYYEYKWTMTPIEYNGDARVYWYEMGMLYDDYEVGNPTVLSYPVINLKANVEFTYNSESTAGTLEDPYVIVTD